MLIHKSMDTVQSRKDIGFPTEKKEWLNSPAEFTEHELKIAGHPVMEDWETGYMDTLAKIATHNHGKVLEVGYGMGISSRAIQNKGVEHHTIIECHPDVVTKCNQDFANEVRDREISVLQGFWEDVTPSLPSNSFDGILFDTYPLTEEEIHGNHFWFFEEAYRLLKPGGVLTYYSDEAKDFSPKHIERLGKAGFKTEDISFKICNVSPPQDCEYWQEKTIIAPIVRKPES